MRIGLSGKFCSGKDTVAAALGLPRYAFADGMKDEVAALLTLKGVTTTRGDLNANKSQYRSMLQVYGTEFIRRFVDDDYWVKRCIGQIPSDSDAVITDVRFPNEAIAVQEAGFTLIRLEVSRPVQVERYQALYGMMPEASQFAHVSEIALDNYHFRRPVVIDADQPLAKVVAQIQHLWAV